MKNKVVETFNEQLKLKDLGFYNCSESTSYTTLYISGDISIHKFDGLKVSWKGGIFSPARIRIPDGRHTFEFDLTTKLPMLLPTFDQKGFVVGEHQELMRKTWSNKRLVATFYSNENYSFWFYIQGEYGLFNTIKSFDYGVETLPELRKIGIRNVWNSKDEFFYYQDLD